MITLTRPQVGTTHTIETHVITRKTAGGDLHQVAPDSWIPVDIFKFIFGPLTFDQKEELLDYLCENMALPVHLEDTEDNEWDGIVVSNEINIRRLARSTETGSCPDSGLFEISFELELL